MIITGKYGKRSKLIHLSKTKFYKKYYECLKKAGLDNEELKYPPYSCRHTTGTELGVSDIPIAVTKELMRHTKISSTEKYIHVDTALMLDAANEARNNIPTS